MSANADLCFYVPTDPIPACRNLTLAVSWTDAYLSTPRRDFATIKGLGGQWADFGHAGEARMSAATFLMLAETSDIRRRFCPNEAITVDAANELLREENLPRVVIDNSVRDGVAVFTGRRPDGTPHPDDVRLTVA